MQKSKKILIVGDSAFAEVAYECFTHDSEYEVVGFAVESKYLEKSQLFGLPIVPLETIEYHFSPEDVEFFAALVYTQLNRLRTRLYETVKAKGYKPASYISSKAFVWHNVQIGEHCFILEDNTLQPFVKIGDNVVLWSGNHVGHHSSIENNCFIASHVVISGFCNIGLNTFMGVNSTLANNVNISQDNWIGPGVTLTQHTEPSRIYKIEQPFAAKVSSLRFFKVSE